MVGDVCTVRGYIGDCDVQQFGIVYNYFVCSGTGDFALLVMQFLSLSPSSLLLFLLAKRVIT